MSKKFEIARECMYFILSVFASVLFFVSLDFFFVCLFVVVVFSYYYFVGGRGGGGGGGRVTIVNAAYC